MNPLWIRRIAIAVGAVLLLLVVAVAVLIATFDANRFKALAVDWMKTERQRTLVIEGPIELSVFPRLAVKVSKLRLSERGRADEFVVVDEATLAVQTLPLLRKQLVVDRVSARGVRALYSRDAQGARNIDDLVGSGGAGPAEPGAAASAPAGAAANLRFDVAAVELKDLQLRVRDAMAPLEADITLQSFTAGRLAQGARTPLTLRAELRLMKPMLLKATLDGSATALIDFERSTVALNELQLALGYDGDAAKGLALDVRGALAWDGQALQAGPLQLDLKSGSQGALVLAPSSLALKRLLYSVAGQKIELEALKLAVAGRQGADQSFEATLDWPQLAVDAQSLKGSALSGRYKLGGPMALAGSFQSGAPAGRFDALRLPGLALTLQGQMQQRKLDGSLKLDALLQAGKGAAALEAIELKATLADPGLQPLQLALRGTAQLDAKAAAWKLEGALSGNRFDSSGRAALGGKVPEVQAQARFDSLDLNKLLLPEKPGAAAPAASGPAPADTPVALDALQALDGRFSLSAGAFALRQYRLSDVKIEAALEAGTLRISRLAGRAWGGTIDASGSAEAKAQRVALKLTADNVNINALLKDVAGKDLLEGTGRVSADVQTGGATVGAMRSRLGGSVALRLSNGAVKGVNLARSFRQAKALLGGRQDTSTKASSTEKTDFSEMSASARLADGVAHSDDLELKSPFLRIGGDGRFDIGRGSIDYTARASVVDTSKGQEGADLAILKGVTVPVRLSGPFEAIDWKIQWSGIASAAVENKLRERLGDKLGDKLGLKGPSAPASGAAAASSPAASAKEKLRERLKGLIR
jgi:AsmA protein